jgi:glycosyltransferase involved in cell wall biosynthesis
VSTSVALSMNVYNDAPALRGALETGLRFFDNLFVIHSGPGGAYSTDGTIELLEQFGAKIVFDDIDRGFGVIRTRCLHECGCDWAAILDADERFFPDLPTLHCEGSDAWNPGLPMPNLLVRVRSYHVHEHPYDFVHQGQLVRHLMEDSKLGAIRATRRHWFDFTMKRPCRNWIIGDRDHQLRIVRNIPEIGYRKDVALHEKIWDSRRNGEPVYSTQDDYQGPFIDHFHPFFRKAYPGTKEWNEENYARLQRGERMVVR